MHTHTHTHIYALIFCLTKDKCLHIYRHIIYKTEYFKVSMFVCVCIYTHTYTHTNTHKHTHTYICTNFFV